MSGTVEARLKSLGLELPVPAAPIANYVPYTVSGSIAVISGQIPFRDGKLHHIGKLGGGMSIEDGQEAAKLCALNILAQLKAAAGGDLDRVRRCLRLGGFVNCTPDFTQQPHVVNGASDLMVAVFGEAGRHARTAVGVGSLPGGVAVEVEAMFELV
ncbi:MAG TPA: RidA family protein [Stellaceae bacterium]|nr:RidA family protein [Stellaceae bacterium]